MATGSDGAPITVENETPDFAVTSSYESPMSVNRRKQLRRPYRRRSLKATNTAIGDSGSHLQCVDSTQPLVSPVEIKQEIVFPSECDMNELFDQQGVVLNDGFSNCGQQQLTDDCGNRLSEANTRNVDSVESCCSSELPVTNDYNGSGSEMTQHVYQPHTASVQTPQPDYEDVIKSMEHAYCDLLPILYRVCNALFAFI